MTAPCQRGSFGLRTLFAVVMVARSGSRRRRVNRDLEVVWRQRALCMMPDREYLDGVSDDAVKRSVCNALATAVSNLAKLEIKNIVLSR
jgi:hypothetical protein